MEKNQLTKFQLAAVKRVAQTVKSSYKKIAKINEKIEKLEAEKLEIQDMIENWEEPVKKMTGGFNSTQVLAGDYDVAVELADSNNEDSFSETENQSGDQSVESYL